MDRSPPGSSVHGDSLGKNTEVGCHAHFQGLFLTQGSSLGLSCIAGELFIFLAMREALSMYEKMKTHGLIEIIPLICNIS